MVGRDARVTGGLRRHGGNRPLPLHKVMDSGNQGYAPQTVPCRPGRCFVVHITSKGGFRRRKWRETSEVPLHFGYAGPWVTALRPYPLAIRYWLDTDERAPPVRPYVNGVVNRAGRGFPGG
ncbi:hypothetical protein B1H20_24860 [Streptomyces violaceoruber]|uniref:Uncharacterized protein n=1 Tax=Streptomyces violaceoruber TaxID=1935 RepID=A0A1V0UG90_STRVN|nr:hypothetical protein B1H20_24860 [Streptomyces violaceoruber]MYW77021.1 hypothetical protein [Streptomyces sp. SID8369]